MQEHKPDAIRSIVDRLKFLVRHWSPPLADESHVNHYLDNCEVEMAYESMILSAMEEKLSCSMKEANELYDIGMQLRMDTGSVFDAAFWTRASAFLKSF